MNFLYFSFRCFLIKFKFVARVARIRGRLQSGRERARKRERQGERVSGPERRQHGRQAGRCACSSCSWLVRSYRHTFIMFTFPIVQFQLVRDICTVRSGTLASILLESPSCSVSLPRASMCVRVFACVCVCVTNADV